MTEPGMVAVVERVARALATSQGAPLPKMRGTPEQIELAVRRYEAWRGMVVGALYQAFGGKPRIRVKMNRKEIQLP